MQLEVDAILFDIDGTLVDSTAAVERTWRAWAAAHDTDPEEILRVCHGRRSQDTIALFLPAEARAAAVEALERLELDDLADTVALPGAGPLLSGLEPGRWAAVTSGPRQLMQARLRAAGLPEPAVLVTAEDVAAGKPDPEGYLRAAAALGVDARRCLVVEDAPAGVEAGRAAGASVLAVATSHDASVLGRAHAVVDDLSRCRVEPGPARLVVTATS
ncbi:HAD-IA family hydrolase [Intrasporangium flavum]|uniref:HAD-IA family hydrolase n=1 Tax=Intrasporangium flavum TaxID=1428657 RepID=UPI00096F6442|nr:HAD-IA family hydrolase [Intrasporangium flavum]